MKDNTYFTSVVGEGMQKNRSPSRGQTNAKARMFQCAFKPSRQLLHLTCATLCTLSLAVVSSRSAEDKLASLYNLFFAEPEKPVFVAFEREIRVPQRPKGQEPHVLPDGRMIWLITPESDFSGFFKSGRAFVVSYAQKPVATNLDTLALADELCGFNGTEYWRLTLNKPARFGKPVFSADSKTVVDSINILTVIQKTHEQTQRASPGMSPHSHVMGVAAEGLTVTQFGCPYPVRKAPTIHGDSLLIEVELSTTNAVLTGRMYEVESGLPRRIEYSQRQIGETIVVELNPENDTMVLTRRAGSNDGPVLCQIGYRLLSVYSPVGEDEMPQIVSYQRYLAGAGPVQAFVKSNAATYIGKLGTNGSVELEARLAEHRGPAAPVSRGVIRAILLGISLAPAAGAAWLLLIRGRIKRNRVL